MTQEKVTRQELREMHIGQTRIIHLVSPKKVQSAYMTCRQMKHEEGLEFRCQKDYEASAISITRIG